MGTQYVCKNRQRRRQVRDSGTALNGIDYLEVLDQGLPDDQRQRLIELRFLKSDALDTLNADNFRIDGGVRIRGVRVIADPVIDGGGPDNTAPTVWLPQRLPWNPGGRGGGSLWGYPGGDGAEMPSDFWQSSSLAMPTSTCFTSSVITSGAVAP